MLEQPSSLRNGNRDQIRLDTSGFSSLSSFLRMIEESYEHKNKSKLTNGKTKHPADKSNEPYPHTHTQTNNAHFLEHLTNTQTRTTKHPAQLLNTHDHANPQKLIKKPLTRPTSATLRPINNHTHTSDTTKQSQTQHPNSLALHANRTPTECSHDHYNDERLSGPNCESGRHNTCPHSEEHSQSDEPITKKNHEAQTTHTKTTHPNHTNYINTRTQGKTNYNHKRSGRETYSDSYQHRRTNQQATHKDNTIADQQTNQNTYQDPT